MACLLTAGSRKPAVQLAGQREVGLCRQLGPQGAAPGRGVGGAGCRHRGAASCSRARTSRESEPCLRCQGSHPAPLCLVFILLFPAFPAALEAGSAFSSSDRGAFPAEALHATVREYSRASALAASLFSRNNALLAAEPPELPRPRAGPLGSPLAPLLPSPAPRRVPPAPPASRPPAPPRGWVPRQSRAGGPAPGGMVFVLSSPCPHTSTRSLVPTEFRVLNIFQLLPHLCL